MGCSPPLMGQPTPETMLSEQSRVCLPSGTQALEGGLDPLKRSRAGQGRAQLGKMLGGEEELGEGSKRKIGGGLLLAGTSTSQGYLKDRSLLAVHRFPCEVPQSWAVVRGLYGTSDHYLDSPSVLGSTTGKSKAKVERAHDEYKSSPPSHQPCPPRSHPAHSRCLGTSLPPPTKLCPRTKAHLPEPRALLSYGPSELPPPALSLFTSLTPSP